MDSIRTLSAMFDQYWSAAGISQTAHVIYSPISHACAMWNQLELQRTWKYSRAQSRRFPRCKTPQSPDCFTDEVGVCARLVISLSLYYSRLQDKSEACHVETWKFPWLTDMAACFEWHAKSLALWGSLWLLFTHTNQEPAWQFVIRFPTKCCRRAVTYTHKHVSTYAQKKKKILLPIVSFYSSSRGLIWKRKCSPQLGGFTSTAEGAQTSGCTALTWPLSLSLLCVSH